MHIHKKILQNNECTFNKSLYKPSKGFKHFLFDGSNVFLQGDSFLDSSVESFGQGFVFLQFIHYIIHHLRDKIICLILNEYIGLYNISYMSV